MKILSFWKDVELHLCIYIYIYIYYIICGDLEITVAPFGSTHNKDKVPLFCEAAANESFHLLQKAWMY